MSEKLKFYNLHYHIQDIKMFNIKTSTCIGIIGSSLVTQWLREGSKREEGILLFCINNVFRKKM